MRQEAHALKYGLHVALGSISTHIVNGANQDAEEGHLEAIDHLGVNTISGQSVFHFVEDIKRRNEAYSHGEEGVPEGSERVHNDVPGETDQELLHSIGLVSVLQNFIVISVGIASKPPVHTVLN